MTFSTTEELVEIAIHNEDMKKILLAIILVLLIAVGFVAFRNAKPLFFVRGISSESSMYDASGSCYWSNLQLKNGISLKIRHTFGNRSLHHNFIEIVQLNSLVPTVVPCQTGEEVQTQYYTTRNLSVMKSKWSWDPPTNFPIVGSVEEVVAQSTRYLEALSAWPTTPETGIIDCTSDSKGMKYWRENSSGPTYPVNAKAICAEVRATCKQRVSSVSN